jgi:hypothetical protein
MANNFIQPPANTGLGLKVRTVEVTENNGPAAGQAVEEQVITIGDGGGTPGAVVSVQQFHNADNQQPGATAYGLLTGGVTQLLNLLGNIDRQREVGQDGIPAIGITTGGAQFAMAFLTTDTTDNFAAGTRTFTPVAMSGTLQGVAWSIQVGSILILDSGGNQETVLVTAVTPTTFTCLTAKAHNGTVTPFPVSGVVYNQERDASGELDGASGAGTNVALEYEYNGGGGGTANAFNSQQNYDRARNLQGKGIGTVLISSGGGIGSTSVVLASAPTGLQPGQPLYFFNGVSIASLVTEVQYVAKNYTPGSTTVPLQTPLIANHSTNLVAWDTYAPAGPGLSGFMPTGVGIEEEALWDPISGLFYIERSATADGVVGNNLVMESPGLFNGSSFDRGRSGSAANLALTGPTGGGVSGTELVHLPGDWSINNTPAAATQATASRAAGAAGVRHVCTSISATLAAGATAQSSAAILNLRDGATGAGTILWSKQVILPANGLWEVNIGGLNIVGSAATAMTLEFAAAGAAGTFESVALTGHDVV